MPFRSTEAEFWRTAFEILHRQKIWEIEAKIFDLNYHPAAGRSSGFQGKNEHKGNLQHVVSSYNSNRRSEECSSMGKKLVLCKKSSKLATSRKVKIFFGSMGDTYKGSRNFRNCKGVQYTFSKKSNTRESPLNATHVPGTSRSNASGDREHAEEGSHTTNSIRLGLF